MGISTRRNAKPARARIPRATAPSSAVGDGTVGSAAPGVADRLLSPAPADAEAARRIRAYVAEHPGSDAFDIGVALGLPWRRVKRIAGDLVNEGQLTEQD